MPPESLEPHPCDSAVQPDALLLRYDEIAMKGRNRARFERLLIRRTRARIDSESELDFQRQRGRIWVVSRSGGPLGQDVLDAARDCAQRIFGLSSLSPGLLVDPSLEALEQAVDRIFPSLYAQAAQHIPAEEPFRYAMRMRRHGNGFGMSSREVEIHFADRLLQAHPRLKVDLRHPDLCIEVEVRPNRAFVSWERIAGPGGLPVGCSGTVLAMISGGIDSPVACRQMMKRGCRVHFVTFHSAPYTPPETVEKVVRLAKILNHYQDDGRLFAVNLLPFQKLVRDRCREKFRTVLYRRMMMRMSCWIAERLHAGSLVTGDCLGQVASQTLRNLNTVERVADRLVLRPLIGYDKKEIVAIAREIGTLEASNLDVPDSCTVFAPSSPTTGAQPHQLEHEERHLLEAAGAIPEDETAESDPFAALMHACFEQSSEMDLDTGSPRHFPLVQ